ncbi:hypothetical protein Cgig2_028604 [Carnegiea gigantea]|uniref:Uncharacterized protein n=1 Tax=Carnegiea gigantea TaxID=171969 RepID=A0A9Q1K5J0_9CARY|nr:hypothetical protein Cgig2_028604 [Carnegiea gigantea]
MAFPCSLNTKEMAEYVVRHFEWDRRGVAFPLSPLSKDFQALCPSYELVVAEEAAEHFELLELPQVIFYAMLLNKAERLGVLHARALRTLESALIELHWMWLYGDRIFEARFRIRADPEESSGAGQQKEDSEVGRGGRAHPLRGRPSLLMMTSRSEAFKALNAQYLPVLQLSLCPFYRSGITGEERRQRTLGMLLSPFIIAFPPLYDTREMADYVRESFI